MVELSNPYPNAGKPWDDEDIDELVIEFFRNEGARRPPTLERFAKRFGRSPGAIEMVFRWCGEADFPERAANRIMRQVAESKKRLGLTSK